MATTFTVDFGGRRRLQASPLTLVYYNEAFSKGQDADLLGDYLSLMQLTNDIAKLSGIKMMRIIWACEKTYSQGALEGFETWVKLLDEIDYMNTDLLKELSSAFEKEYFRKSAKPKQHQPKEDDETNELSD